MLGAIVDRNRLQRAAANKAEALKLRTVRLPLDKHLTMDKTKVLTVNHCLDLLTRVGHGEKWGEALQRTLPSRKNAEFDEGSHGGDGGGDGCSGGGGAEGGKDEGGEPVARTESGKGKRGNKKSSQKADPSICYQFQRGECTRGAACKFSHSTDNGGKNKSGGDGGQQGESEVPNGDSEFNQTRKKRKNTESASTDPTYCRDMRFL